MAKKGMSDRAKATLAHRDADLLVKIAIVFTTINALIVLFFLDKFVDAAARLGLEVTASNGALLAVAWLFLALFAKVANDLSRTAKNKRPMWGLLLVGILLLITGRVESAILVGVSALLYLYRFKGK